MKHKNNKRYNTIEEILDASFNHYEVYHDFSGYMEKKSDFDYDKAVLLLKEFIEEQCYLARVAGSKAARNNEI